MNYTLHYNRLVERARRRELTGYVERHHIIPRCLGGGDEPDNIARLTAEEHFVAHQLLVKMHPGNHRLVWALSAMTHSTKRMRRPPNKRYGWLRRRFAETMRERYAGKPLSAEHRAKLSEAAKTRSRAPHSAEARANMSAAAKGHTKSAAHRAALSRARTGKKYGPRSEETRAKQSAAIRAVQWKIDRSKYITAEYRAKQSAKMKEVWAARKLAKQEAKPLL